MVGGCGEGAEVVASTVFWELDKRERLLGPEDMVAERVGLLHGDRTDFDLARHGAADCRGCQGCWRLG